MIQQRHTLGNVLHDAPSVDDAINMLRPLVLIDIDHQPRTASRGFPVDCSEIIANHIVLDVLEIGVMAYPADAFQTKFSGVVTECYQLVMAKHQVGGINLHILRLTLCVAAFQQSDGCLAEQPDIPEIIDATTGRTQFVLQGETFAWLEFQTDIGSVLLVNGRYFVDDSDSYRERIRTIHTDSHHVVVSIRESVGHDALGVYPLSAP